MTKASTGVLPMSLVVAAAKVLILWTVQPGSQTCLQRKVMCTCCQLSSLCSPSLQCHIKVLPPAAESAVDNLDDIISVKFIQEIIDWCGSHPVISRVSDTSRVYLCGHSRVSQPSGCCSWFQAASGCMYCDHWSV